MGIAVTSRPLIILCWLLTAVDHGAVQRIEITDIQATCDRDFLSFNSSIHSNRTMFDIFFTLHHALHTHDLFMNIKLKTKSAEASRWATVRHWRRVSLCTYLRLFMSDSGSLFKHFFKQQLATSSSIRCPLRKGDYYMKNFELEQSALVGVLPEGSYRVFVEIAHVSGEVVKLFALQVTANFHN